MEWLRRSAEKRPSLRQGALFYLLAILGVLSCRHFIFSHDPNKCQALLNQGLWYQGSTWLTPGCVSERYRGSSINDCADGRKIIFFGDAQLLGTYWAIVQKLDEHVEPQDPEGGRLHYSNDHVQVEFVWDPLLNGTELFSSVEAYRNASQSSPMLIVLGAGRWYAENDKVAEFVQAVDKIASAAPSTHGLGLWSFTATDGPGNLMLFAPVQEPYSDGSDAPPALEAYRTMNAHLTDLANRDAIDMLRSFDLMTSSQKERYHSNGIDVRDEVAHRRADVLLGLRCNAKAALKGTFPNTRTCCGTWAGPNWIQSGFLIIGLILLPALIQWDKKFEILEPGGRPIALAFFAFTATVSLQYITDRTHIFEQVQRFNLVMSNLRNMTIIAFLAGMVTVRRSNPPKKPIPGGNSPDHPFLPRDQTDEWKGWMQLLIIIYHYNIGWTSDWVWEIIRLCVSSYLFLTGFGHTIYFLQKQDYSLHRVAAVLLRTNLLPCTLAYVMRTRWLLYYYMPLSTFWFLIVYATLAAWPTYNQYQLFVIGKIVVSAALVNAFISTRDLPETIVRFFAITCKISFDAADFFHYRVKIDQYIVYVGMLVAMAYIWVIGAMSTESPRGGASRLFRRIFPWLKYISIAVALVALVAFVCVVHARIRSQGEWRHQQPYISFIPILAFLVLRNAHSSLRNFHSVAFAWLGRYSGEMYVMQDHIWLAGDQDAVLRTGFFHGDETVPGDRWKDLVLITPLFLIACWLVGDATASITTWFVKESPPTETDQTKPTERTLREVETGLLNGVDADSSKEHVGGEKMPPPNLSVVIRDAMATWRLWPGKVRDRAILVLVCMWFMNMTYT